VQDDPEHTTSRRIQSYFCLCRPLACHICSGDYTANLPTSDEDPGCVGAVCAVEGRADNTSGIGTATVMRGGYRLRPEPLAVVNRMAKSTKSLRLRTLWRLSSYDTLLERLAQDLQDMAAELGQFIQEEHAIVGQRHVTGHWHVAPADSPASAMV
jgi:hypothetical protein